MKKSGFFTLGLFISLIINAQDAQKGVEKILGEKTLPDISLMDVNGNKVNVTDYGKRGKLTIMDFWATWCIPCKKELNNISEVYEDWSKKYNVQIVAVSIDDSRASSKVKPYVDGQRWDFQVLLDVNQDLMHALNIQSVPFTVVIDEKGRIISTHSGYVEGDEYIIEGELQKLAAKTEK